MAASNDEVKIIVKAAVEDAYKNIEKLKGALKSLGGDAEEAQKGITGAFTRVSKGIDGFADGVKKKWAELTAGLAGTFLTIKNALDITKQASDFREASEYMHKQFGVSADRMIVKVKEATNGIISNSQIVASANKAMSMGVTKDMNQIAEIYKIAEVQGKSTGKSISESFDIITEAIGRGRPGMLAQVGISKELVDAWEKQAEAQGGVINSQTLLNGVLDEGRKNMAKMGESMPSISDRLEMVNASIEDAKISFGEALIPIFEKVLPIVLRLVNGFSSMPMPIKAVAVAVSILVPAVLLLNSALGPIGLLISGIGAAAVITASAIGGMNAEIAKMREMPGEARTIGEVNERQKIIESQIKEELTKKYTNKDQSAIVSSETVKALNNYTSPNIAKKVNNEFDQELARKKRLNKDWQDLEKRRLELMKQNEAAVMKEDPEVLAKRKEINEAMYLDSLSGLDKELVANEMHYAKLLDEAKKYGADTKQIIANMLQNEEELKKRYREQDLQETIKFYTALNNVIQQIGAVGTQAFSVISDAFNSMLTAIDEETKRKLADLQETVLANAAQKELETEQAKLDAMLEANKQYNDELFALESESQEQKIQRAKDELNELRLKLEYQLNEDERYKLGLEIAEKENALKTLQIKSETDSVEIKRQQAKVDAQAKAAAKAKADEEDAKKKIQEEADAKKKEINKQAFEWEKAGKVSSILMTTAQAVMQTIAASPLTFGLPWSAIIAGLGLTESGIALGQKNPYAAMGALVEQPSLVNVAEGGKRELILPNHISEMFIDLANRERNGGGIVISGPVTVVANDPQTFVRQIDAYVARGGRF